MRYGLGIDLGTTQTAAAVQVDGRVEVVRLGGRRAEIPSLVFIKPDGSLLIGEAAERRGQTEPERLAREFKRRIGDPVPILVGGTPFSAHSLTAKLLRHVLDTVAQLQDGPPSAVIVTHPANWGPYKREQLDQALRLADAGPVQVRSEPEAAALQHATARQIAPGETVAVYDLGGGTFDVAVLRRDGDGFALLGEPEGIEQLGGIDFDEAVFGHVLEVLGSMADGLDPDDPEVLSALTRLRRDCVEAKEALSFDTETMIPVALPGLHTRVRLNRSELESMIAPALADTVAATGRALRAAGVAPAEVSAILLAGGSSRIPLVAQLLSTEFQRPVVADPHPEHSIALGAAVATAGILGGSSPFASAAPTPRGEQRPDATLIDPPGGGSPVASPRRGGSGPGPVPVVGGAAFAGGGAGAAVHPTGAAQPYLPVAAPQSPAGTAPAAYPRTSPGSSGQPGTATPGQAQQPAATPGHVQQPAATPGHVQQPAATPGHAQQPAATPGHAQQPAATPSRGQQTNAAPSNYAQQPGTAAQGGTAAPGYAQQGGSAPAGYAQQAGTAPAGQAAQGGGATPVSFSRGAAAVPGVVGGGAAGKGGPPDGPASGGGIAWPPPPPSKRRHRIVIMAAAAAVAVIAGGAAAAVALTGDDKKTPEPTGAGSTVSTPPSVPPSEAAVVTPTLPTEKILVRVDKVSGGERKSTVAMFTPGKADRTAVPGTKDGDVLPKWSNDRQQIALTYTRKGGDDITRKGGSDIYLMNRDGSNRRRILEDAGGEVSWAPDDKSILFMRKNQIWHLKLDGSGKTRQLTDSSVVKDDAVFSPSGEKLIYWRNEGGVKQLFELDVNDPQEPGRRITGPEVGPANDPAFSPDGSKILYTRELNGGKTSDIWMVDLTGANPHQVTSHPEREMDPTWSPDGQWFAFVRGAYADPTIVIARPDGTNELPQTKPGDREGHPCWF